MERAGNAALALDLARIAQVHDHHIGKSRPAVRKPLDGLGRIDGLDLRIGFVEKFLVTAGDGGGHDLFFPFVMAGLVPAIHVLLG